MIYQWERLGACKGMDVGLFFDYEDTPGKQPPPEVKQACAYCPVRDSCLEEAIAYEPFGFRGGKTAGQRRSLRKRIGLKVVPIHDYLVYDPANQGLLADIHAPDLIEPLQLTFF